MALPSQSPPRRRQNGISLKLVVLAILFGVCCFYVGIIVGAHSVHIPATEELCAQFINKADQEQKKISELKESLFEPRFPKSVSDYAKGMVLVDRNNFTNQFDMGVPVDPSGEKNEQVLIWYAHPGALPSSKQHAMEAESNHHLPTLSVEDATQNCDTLNVILSATRDPRQCFAVMGQYRSYHLQKFMRLPEKEGEKLDRSVPLRYVNRGAQTSGRVSTKHPSLKDTMAYWEILKNYLSTLDAVLKELRPLADKAAAKHNNAVTVMVLNWGQAHLLMNWVCASHARGLDTSGVLIFATDQETKDLAVGLGLNVFYDEVNYANMPKEAAARYADETFSKMMMAKVYCVHQIMMLGYDVLFQDVDVVWFKDPLKYFQEDMSASGHEMYFQDDGSRGLFYAPYSANTGVYYVRNNGKTRYFFNSLLMSGDLIMSTHSHQIALVSLLSEHASVHGLRIKVLSRDTDGFPGGYAFHNRPEYMKKFFNNEVSPFLFHMSWTANKVNKHKFFRQIGNWFVHERCTELDPSAIAIVHGMGKPYKSMPNVTSGVLLPTCCNAEPLYQCYYKDKPSLKPCPFSPTLDDKDKSFW